MSHYYSNDYTKSNKKTFEFDFNSTNFAFTTDDNVFSKSEIDFGSNFLVETILLDASLSGNVLDLGCGYGAMTILLSKFSQAQFCGCDINERAVELAKENAQQNGVADKTNFFVSDACDNVELSNFDFVVSNPPIRAGNAVLEKFFSGAFEKLKKGGISYWVFRKQQGAETYTKKLSNIFGNSSVVDKKKSFWVVKSIKE